MLQHTNSIIIFSASSTLQTSTYKPDPTYKSIYAPNPTETSIFTTTSIFTETSFPTVFIATSIPTVFTNPTVSTYSTGSETVLPLLIFLTYYAVMSTMFLCYYCLGFSCNGKCKCKGTKSSKSELPVHDPPTETTAPTSPISPTTSGLPTRLISTGLNSTNYTSPADSTYSTVYQSLPTLILTCQLFILHVTPLALIPPVPIQPSATLCNLKLMFKTIKNYF
jgi:hypothetical protein